MSIFSCLAPYFPLVSGCLWTFLLLFSTLCPFSPARLRISLWLPDVFGLFPAFSVLYVHSHRLSSVFLSGFRRILDFFLLFSALCPFSPARFSVSLCLHVHFGLFSCFSRPYVHFLLLSSVFLSSFTFILDFFPCFSLLYVHFHLLSSVFLSSFTFILDFFPCFSLLYVHFHLLSSVFPSGFTFILDFFPVFLSFMSIWKNTEDSGPRKAALRRIKRSAITAFLFQKLLFRLPS